MPAFLLRFKANYVEKIRGYPHFSLWILTALAKIYFVRMHGPNLVQKLCIYQAPSLNWSFVQTK